MIITIDTEMLDKYTIRPDEYVYLSKLLADNALLSKVLLRVDGKKMVRMGFVEIDDGQAFLTDKARDLFKMPREGFITPKIDLSELTSSSNIKDLSKKYRELFPVGVRSGGYLVRATSESCEKKLKAFLRKYSDYDEAIILEATKRYIDRKARVSYMHMKLAPYFIEKDGISMLAAECEELISEGTDGRSDDDWGKDV
tara:strand:- start:6541 stop:7134 length:594 start_codon:yes stop_codon:yes gene_type:complete